MTAQGPIAEPAAPAAGAEPPRRSRLLDELRGGRLPLAARIAAVVAITALAGFAGLFWAGQRAAREVIATVSADLTGEVGDDGTFTVTEALLVEAAPREGALERLIPAPAGGHVRLLGVRDDAGEAVAITTLRVEDGLAVRLPEVRPAGLYTLRYEVAGVVAAHPDVAELAWPLLDARNRLVFSDLIADASWLPGAGEPLVVETESHGPRGVTATRDGGVRWDAGRVEAHAPAELSAAFQLLAVPGLDPRGDERLEEMLESSADAAANPPAPGGGGPALVPLLLAAAFLAAWWLIHRAKGREHRVGPVGDVVRPPTQHPPAEVGWLLRFGTLGPVDLAATLVDLAERGHLVIDSRAGVLRSLSDAAERDDLAPHERTALDWLFPDGVAEVAVAERVARIGGDPDTWRTLWREFSAAVDASGRRDGLVERSADAESVLGVGVLSASVVVAGVIGMAAGQPWWIACIAAGASVLAFADTLARRSRAGAEAAARWTAFGRHLEGAVPVASTAITAGRHTAHALVLAEDRPRPAEDGSSPAAFAVDAVERWRAAFVTATSFNAAPSRRFVALIDRARR